MPIVKDAPPLSPDEKKHLPILKEKEDPPAEIFLSGIAVTEAGKLTKHKYFEFLGTTLDDYSDLSFTPEEAVRIRGQLGKMKTGSTAMVPLTCSGSMCSFKDKCVFYKMGKAPFGRSCLLEINMLQDWIIQLIEQYDVDPSNFTEITMVSKIAEVEIYLWRLNQLLGQGANAELIADTIVGFMSPQNGGHPIKEKKISPYLEAKNMLEAKQQRLIKLMVGDRQEKYKRDAALKTRENTDPSSKMADARAQLERIQSQLSKLDIQIKEETGQLINIPNSEKKSDSPKQLSPDDLIGTE